MRGWGRFFKLKLLIFFILILYGFLFMLGKKKNVEVI